MEVGVGDVISLLPKVPHGFEVISNDPLCIMELVVYASDDEKQS